jgi:hypothetical protein
MKVKIEIFNNLDKIALLHRITDEEWAKSSNIRRPSISELRRLYLDRQEVRSIGRACTIEKIGLLFIGLYNILGGDVLKKEMMAVINNETNQDVRMMMLSLLLRNAPKETKDAIEGSMKMAVQTIATRKTK